MPRIKSGMRTEKLGDRRYYIRTVFDITAAAVLTAVDAVDGVAAASVVDDYTMDVTIAQLKAEKVVLDGVLTAIAENA